MAVMRVANLTRTLSDLAKLRQLLKNEGVIRLKTDSSLKTDRILELFLKFINPTVRYVIFTIRRSLGTLHIETFSGFKRFLLRFREFELTAEGQKHKKMTYRKMT